ncbi:ABC transporter permease [Candidatus Falkowbacteria bacterium]|nr:ABC transporter permease [Candidatus Falkowbacteria bacterium]
MSKNRRTFSGLKKYWIVCQNGMQKVMVYRLNFFAWFFVEGLGFLVMAYIWLSIYKQGNQVGSYTLATLLCYFAISRVLGMVVTSDDMARQINEDISQGRLVNFLLKPISYSKKLFFQNTGEIIIAAIYTLPVAIPVAYYFRDQLAFTATRILLFLIAIMIACFMDFFFNYLIGTLTFYSENIFGIIFLSWTITGIFSGRVVPIDLLPGFLQHLADFLPFKYVLFIPLSIISGRIDPSAAVVELGFGLAWVIALWYAGRLIFNSGLKRYEGYGI